MPYWSPLLVNGVEYDLSHLEPLYFTIDLPVPDTTATIAVSFHDHCFSETFDPSRHSERLITNRSSMHEQRAFALDRYELSLGLPGIIRGLGTQKIAFANESNMVKVTLQDGRTYPMFFTLRRAGARRVDMFVVSAYEWTQPGSPIKTGTMRFNMAVMKVLRGEKLKFPRR